MKKHKIVPLLFLCLLVGCSSPNSTVPGQASDQEGSSRDSAQSSGDTAKSCFAATEILTALPSPVRIGFAGDMNLARDWCTMEFYNQQENGIYDCISQNLIEETNGLDLFMPNNEFAYSNRGAPMEGKAYTFCADPARVDILTQLGTDLVLLANNHVFDYGADAFSDTLDTLTKAHIPYVGAGQEIEEASRPCYMTCGTIKIAFVAATRAEKNILTPEAGPDSPGVLRCYDSSAFLSVIREASRNADYVIASVHFGTEYSNQADTSQRELVKSMIDAGADAVIGSHAHVLQGIEFYKGCPVIYSLGNFWFNEKTLYSCLFELELDPSDASLHGVKFIPCIQENYRTTWPKDPETQRRIWDFEEGISFGISIDDNGYVREKN